MKRLAFVMPVLLICVLLSSSTEAAVVKTVVRSGLNGAYGSDYLIGPNQSFFVERYAGRIWRVNMTNRSSAVLGTGYVQPMDVAASADPRFLYVIENGNGGTLLRVPVATPNRASAIVVSTNIAGTSGQILHQIALDEAHNCAYVVQNTVSGTIWRINLLTGAKLAILSNIAGKFGTAPGGLLLNKDSTFAYFTTFGTNGKLIRLDLSNGTAQELLAGLTNPSYLDWANSNESAILLAHSGQVSTINITQVPVILQPLVTGLNVNTRSVRRIADDRLLVNVNDTVFDVSLTPFSAAGPIILGIGHVPFDRIVGGYATTTGDPGIPLQVRNAPFGGTLDLMINHRRAYLSPMDARWYKVLVDSGVEPKQSWSDYLWNSTLGRFVVETIHPDAAGFYAVRSPSALWYEPWLGYRLDTSGLTNGSHTIRVRMYKADKVTLAAPESILVVRIDNRWPTAIIEKIYHDGIEVPACGMVTGGSDTFTFRITANDPDGHLASWSLSALWGENQSALIASDSYYPAHLASVTWAGIAGVVVPRPAWIALETCCAHTFHLSVWDRTIDGHNYIHWSGYNKSITIMTGCALGLN